ncbi:MAG: SpoVR family protein [Anaerolineae bacterium]
MTTELPASLAKVRDEIREVAIDYGLNFFEVIYEMLDFDQMNQVAALGGFPNRYPHWSFGMEYERLRKSYAYGLHRIYEMVINNDPCYAYLLVSNEAVDQKLVMAHVYAHSDFFKNNLWFAHTNRKMMDKMANHATHIRRYMDRFGEDEVEDFIDVCLSIENLIDPHLPGIRRRPIPEPEGEEETAVVEHRPGELPAREYMDSFINPPAVLAEEARRVREEHENRKTRFPADPERDVMLFLLEHAPLDTWQQDVLAILREEAYYFLPQRQTKIMNEGWASFWHSTIMTQSGVMTDAEVIDYADHHSGTVAVHPGRLNPYKMGMELFRDIEERWDKGRFGAEYEQSDDLQVKANWDQQLGWGRQKVFEVRRIYNDLGFIDTFLTEDFARRHRMFTYGYNQRREQFEIESREFEEIKQKLLFALTNAGQPIIRVQDANHSNRGELLLSHEHGGIDLEPDYARDTLENIYKIWSRPVHIDTVGEEQPERLTFDGRDHRSRKLS